MSVFKSGKFVLDFDVAQVVREHLESCQPASKARAVLVVQRCYGFGIEDAAEEVLNVLRQMKSEKLALQGK